MPVASEPMVASWCRMRYPFDKSEAVYQLERMLNVTFDIVRSDDEYKKRIRDGTGVDVFVGGNCSSHVFNYATHIMKDDIRVRSEMFFVAESASAIPLNEQTLSHLRKYANTCRRRTHMSFLRLCGSVFPKMRYGKPFH
jgi:hypothetical protein